ncbi:MAG: PIN domain-containing protein [bacterium]
MRVFLDANVLFSAAYGSPRLETLWSVATAGGNELLVSAHVVEEARRNLTNPHHLARLDALIGQTALVASAPPDLACPIDLPPGDREAFMAALAARATHFLTGDTTHFGHYYGQSVGGVLIQTPGVFLLRRKRG